MFVYVDDDNLENFILLNQIHIFLYASVNFFLRSSQEGVIENTISNSHMK